MMTSTELNTVEYKKGRLPIVRVEWLDSNTAAGWHSLDSALDWAQNGIINCVSIGYLVYEDAERIVLAMHLFLGKDNDPLLVANIGDLTVIPRATITKIKTEENNDQI